MRQRFLRISGFRRSAVHLSQVLLCSCNAFSVLQLLLRCDCSAVWRCLQLLIILTQGGLSFSLALAKHAPPAFEFGSVGSLAPLATHSDRGFLLSEFMRLLLHVTLSWYPLESVNPGTCHIPRINILMQQAVHTAQTAILDIPANKSMQSLLLMPVYGYLDWRYASLNGIPGNATLLQYLSRRGALMLLSKVLFSGIPALIMMRSHTAQQVAVYAFCLPLLAVQCFVSGMRLLHGVDNVGLWEVWMATVVAFGIGTDVGHVVEELRAQFSKVRKIADDILPHHVVDTLMQQQRQHVEEEEEEEAEPPEQRQPMEQQPPGPQEALPSAAGPRRPLVRTSSASTVPLSASLPQLRSAVSMSPPSSAAPPEARQQLFPSSSQPAAGGSGGGGKSHSRSAELPVAPLSARRSPARRTSALTTTDEAEYAEEHPGACILFADVCGFTTISEGTSPALIVNMLNKLFSKFDEIISESRFLYKLDVIGDCYMVASGLHWHAEDTCAARSITDFAQLMLQTAATVLDPVTLRPLSMRCGIHKGPVVGALLGTVRRKYSLFGDVVNAASRLESTSRPGAIHVSAAIYQQLWRPSTCVDGQMPLQRTEPELHCVEEDGEQEPGALGSEQDPAARGTGTSNSRAMDVPAMPVAESTRLTPGSGAGSSSTWGSLRLHVTAAGEEAEGRSLAGMGLLAIGPPAGEEAAGQVEAALSPVVVSAGAKDGSGAGRPRGAEQDHLGSDQNDPPADRPASLPALGVAPAALGTVRCLSEQQQRSSAALPAASAGPGPGRDAVRDPTGEELWLYRGRIDLKGRAALETYILQVV